MAEPITAFLATVGAAIGGQAGATLIIYATEIAAFAAQAAAAVALSSYGSHQKRKAERSARAAYNAGLRDRTQTVRGTLEPRQLILGKVRTGGAIAFIGSSGANKEKLTLVIALASNECTAVDAIYFNDVEVTLDGSGWVQTEPWYKTRTETASANMTVSGGAGSVVLPYTPIADSATATIGVGSGEDSYTVSELCVIAGATVSVSALGGASGTATVSYQHTVGTSHARVRSMLGTTAQTAFADLITNFPAQWTANHRLREVCYLVVELDYNADAFPTGIPNVSAVVRGSNQIYDPRTLTTGYSENPAMLLRHYLLHTLGGRLSSGQIDEASFIAAANVCDASVNYGDGAVALYTAGLVARTDTVPAQIADELIESMAGRWGWSNGAVRIRAGALASTSAAVTVDWIAGGSVTIQPRPSRLDLANTAQGVFIDPVSNWQLVQFPRVIDSAAVTEDGATLVRELEFGAVTRAGQAQQLAGVMLRDERQALTVQIVLNMRSYALQMLDVVTLTIDRFGFSAKLFEVIDRAYTHGGGIAYTLKETGSSVFAFGSSFAAVDPEPNTTLPAPWIVPTVGTVTATSGTSALSDGSVVSRCTIAWPAVADRGVSEGGFMELAYRDVAGLNAEQLLRADTMTGHTIHGLRVGYHYVFKARAVNGALVRGNWSAQIIHQIDGPQKLRTWVQTTAPSGVLVQDGDRWIDSDAGNKEYIRSGGAWVEAGGLGTTQLVAEAATQVQELTSATTSTTLYGASFLCAYGMSVTPSSSGKLALTVTFDASGVVGFEAERWAAGFIDEIANVTVGTDPEYADADIDIATCQFTPAAYVATTRTKCSVTALFDVAGGTQYLVGLAVQNTVAATDGLTLYGPRYVQTQVIKR